MATSIAIGAAGAVVAAGASAAGAAASKPGGVKPQSGETIVTDTLPQLDPLAAASSFESLANLGIINPTGLLQAGPIGQMIQRINQTAAPIELKRQLIRDIGSASEQAQAGNLDEFLNSQLFKNLQTFFGGGRGGISEEFNKVFGGAFNLEDVFRAEQQYRQQITPIIQRLQEQAPASAAARAGLLSQFADVSGRIPEADLGNLREQAKQRLLGNLRESEEEVRGRAIREANIAGFNPGGELGEISERGLLSREAIDINALSEALALLGGQQTAVGTELGQLQSAIQFGQNPTQQQINLGAQSQFSNVPQQTTNPNRALTSNIANAGLLAGGAINEGLLAFQQNRGPATGTGSLLPAQVAG